MIKILTALPLCTIPDTYLTDTDVPLEERTAGTDLFCRVLLAPGYRTVLRLTLLSLVPPTDYANLPMYWYFGTFVRADDNDVRNYFRKLGTCRSAVG